VVLDQYGEGKCINCGFLGCRDGDMRISECYPASRYARDFGTLNEYVDPRPKGVTEIVPNIKTFPWCFVGKANLKNDADELFDAKDEELNRENVCIHRVITKSRNCSSWYPWREFATPKEHYEEFKMLQLEQQRQEFEQKMEKDRRGFELKLEEINEHERKRTDNIMIGLAIVGVILALAQIFTATPDSIIFRWFN